MRTENEALNGKIQTLLQSIKEMTEEKNSMLKNFQNDKKMVAESHRAQVAALKEEVRVIFRIFISSCLYFSLNTN